MLEIWTQSPRYGASETRQLHTVGVKCSGSPVSLRALARSRHRRLLVGLECSWVRSTQLWSCWILICAGATRVRPINGRTLALLGLDKIGIVKERHIWNWDLFSFSFVWKISGEYDAVAHESPSVSDLVTI